RFSRDWSSDVCSSDLIEHIVLDLEGEPEFSAISSQRVIVVAGVDARTDRAEQYAGTDQRAGLATVHALHRGGIQPLADAFQVDGLAAGHAGGADALCQHLDLLQPRRG